MQSNGMLKGEGEKEGKGRKYLHTEKFKVEKNYEAKVIEILKQNGFKDIKKMPYQSLFDFIVNKDGEMCYVELKSRSETAKTQTFSFSNSKLERLKELQATGTVYLLFINKYGYRLVKLDDFLAGKTNMKKFEVYCFTGKKYNSYSFDIRRGGWYKKETKKEREKKERARIKEEKRKKKEEMEMMYSEDEAIFPPRIVAPIFGICPETLRLWTKRGFIHAERTSSGRYLFSEAEIRRVRKRMQDYTIPSLRGTI